MQETKNMRLIRNNLKKLDTNYAICYCGTEYKKRIKRKFYINLDHKSFIAL